MKQKTEVIKEIIDQMFIIAGHPEVGYDDVVGRKDEWYLQWSMTEDQRKEWMEWGVKLLRKRKRWSKKIAESEMAYIDLYCGLTTKQNEKVH